MKEINRKRIIKIIALLLPLVLFWVAAENFLFYHSERNTDRFRRFYNEEPNSIDVVFLGASEVFVGFAPGYAYDQFGFTSYLYVTDANEGSLYKYQLKEVLTYQDPQVIFVEVFGFLRSANESIISKDRMRVLVESIPMSRNKLDLIREYPGEQKISYFIPFLKYHDEQRMIVDNITAFLNNPLYRDRKAPSLLKGIATTTVVYEGPGDTGRPDDPAAHVLSQDAQTYLIDFLEYCKQEKLDNVVFVNFPRYLENVERHDLTSLVKQVEGLVNQYDYQFLDLQNTGEETGIDLNTDFYNSHHMNMYGQIKMTEYLGDLVMNTYKITPVKQTPEAKANWEASAESTQEFFEIAEQFLQNGYVTTIQEDSYDWLFRDKK